MMHHPVKRSPIPYIYASINFPGNPEPEITKKSNAIPPCWNQDTFEFKVPESIFKETEDKNENNKAFRITFIESRLFMIDEPLGFCDIYIPMLPQNQLLVQWAVLTPIRPSLPKILCLLMIQFNRNPNFLSAGEKRKLNSSFDSAIFNAPLVESSDLLKFYPFDQREVEPKYLIQTHLKNSIVPSENDENNKVENSQEESEFKSPLKDLLKMFY